MWNWRKKEKAAVYLGVVAVVPRKDLKRIFESLSGIEVEHELRQHLQRIIALPILEFIVETNIQTNLLQIKAELLEGMREYMNDVFKDGGDPGYTESDIGKCEAILDNFLAKIHVAPAGDTDSVMLAVKDAVLALNALNENCDCSLIETEQREEICELIIQGAAAVGVGSGEDITEEWREW